MIKNRKQLFEYLENIMSNTYEKIKDEGELEYEQNLLKTYILESNISKFNIPINTLQESYQNKLDISIEKTEDKTLNILSIAKKKKKVEFYADTFNPRFWILHTVGNSQTTDSIVKTLVNSIMSRLDHPWLDKRFLEGVRSKNADYTKGIGIQYKYGKIFPDGEDNMTTFTMRAWGSLSEDILRELEKNEKLQHTIAVTSVGIKKIFGDNAHGTIIEDINYKGKFSAKGTLIQAHLDLVEEIKDTYANKLKAIEDEYLFFYEKKEHRVGVSGSPLLISFKRAIDDLGRFLDVVVSSKIPFRLTGFKRMLEKDLFLVAGIDLHNGDKFEMEVSTNWIRLYLPKGACGNTALRLVSNLQRYYDSNATLEGMENGRIV